MPALLPTASLLSLDGLVVCLALGPLGPGATRRLPLAFALCDGLASLAGPALGLPDAVAWAHGLAPAAVATYGLLVLALAARIRSADRANDLVYLLPVLLSLDNLV